MSWVPASGLHSMDCDPKLLLFWLAQNGPQENALRCLLACILETKDNCIWVHEVLWVVLLLMLGVDSALARWEDLKVEALRRKRGQDN